MEQTKKNKTRLWLGLGIAGAAALAAVVHWYPQVRCYLFYPECSPFLAVPEMPNWNIPTDPQEKAAYDYAHALKLPPGLPEPVPFDFRAARLSEGAGGHSVAQQYFEHLCATEDVEVIHRRVADVDGFRLLRPRGKTEGTAPDVDRYGTEEPVGFGGLGDDNQLEGKPIDFLGERYVQPLYGVYRYVEFEQPGQPGRIVKVVRAAEDRKRFPYGVEANWRPPGGGAIRAPYLLARTTESSFVSRYAYTWRGLRRPRDREFGIAGAEFLLVDVQTNEVLGVKRTFNSTYAPRRPGFTVWSWARECRSSRRAPPMSMHVRKVLMPAMDVNDAYVPPANLEEYRRDLKKQIERNYADQ